MRRLAVIPLALLFGCWDFDSLSGGYVPPAGDLSIPGDIACGKAANQLKEDCTQNGDVNNNCLIGCDDPDCSDHVLCFASKGYKGYGAVVDNPTKCPMPSTATMIYQNLAAPPANCNGSCSANSTTSCTSTLHIYANMNDCAGKQNATNVSLATGTACTTATIAKNAYYQLDTLTAGGSCTPKMASLFLPATWGTTNVLCDQSASKIDTFGGMRSNGIACVVFNGTDPAVCQSTKIYPKASVYYQGTVANNSITCTCAAASNNTCNLVDGMTNQLNLSDKPTATCATGAALTPIKDTNCTAAANAAVSISNTIMAPGCNVTGAVTGAYAPKDGITVCCM